MKFLSVLFIEVSVAHTSTIPSPSPTLIMAGTDTVTSVGIGLMVYLVPTKTLSYSDYKPSLSVMIMVVSLFPSITSGSDEVSITMKVMFPSNISSFSKEMVTHSSMEPEVKITSAETLA